jgi:hypothetical protein
VRDADGSGAGRRTPDAGEVAVVEVAGGCACCAARVAFGTALTRLLRRGPWDRLFVETTGLGHPAGLVDQLRAKGAIIFAKAVCTEYNGRAADPGGRHRMLKVLPSTIGYQRSTWGGNPSNPYDTTRSGSLGSSSGSGVSVSTNMVMASLGEETRASCRGPSNHNSVALILPHKSMIGFDGGAQRTDKLPALRGMERAECRNCSHHQVNFCFKALMYCLGYEHGPLARPLAHRGFEHLGAGGLARGC